VTSTMPRRVAEQVGIPYYVVTFEQQFEDRWLKPCVAPNTWPDARRFHARSATIIKFDGFLKCRGVGARQIATATTRASI